MKKFILSVLVGLMVMATASIAAAEVTVGGNIAMRYALWQNLNLNSDRDNFQTINFFNSRVMLNVDAKITEGLEGFVELETGTDTWGLTPSLANVPGYLNSIGANGVGSTGLGNSVAIRQAWINFMIPGVPVGIKAGHQPLALGHGIWLDTSRYGSEAILVYSKPIDPLLIAFAYVQGSQSLPVALTAYNGGAFNRINGAAGGATATATAGITRQKDDADFYALLANYTWMPGNTVGVNATYVDDKASLYPSGIKATNTAFVADGVIGPLTYKGEVDWLYVNTNDFFGAEEDYYVSAWAAMLGVGAKAGPVNIGAEVAYGTGNDDNDPGIFYNPGNAMNAAVTGRKDHAYYTPYNSTSYNYAFLYNDKIGQGPYGFGGGAGFGDGYGGFGLANTGYVKVSASINPTPKLKVGLDALYLRASETMLEGQSRSLGWEVDANVAYKLYDNLSLNVVGGVFVPGAWYAFQGHDDAAASLANTLTDETDLGSPIKRDTAWGMQTSLVLKF